MSELAMKINLIGMVWGIFTMILSMTRWSRTNLDFSKIALALSLIGLGIVVVNVVCGMLLRLY